MVGVRDAAVFFDKLGASQREVSRAIDDTRTMSAMATALRGGAGIRLPEPGELDRKACAYLVDRLFPARSSLSLSPAEKKVLAQPGKSLEILGVLNHQQLQVTIAVTGLLGEDRLTKKQTAKKLFLREEAVRRLNDQAMTAMREIAERLVSNWRNSASKAPPPRS